MTDERSSKAREECQDDEVLFFFCCKRIITEQTLISFIDFLLIREEHKRKNKKTPHVDFDL